MSFLTLTLTDQPTLDMNKVTLSFWFRVPKESARKVKERTTGTYYEYSVFEGVIPLITWGSQQTTQGGGQQTTKVTTVESYDTGALDVSAGHIMLERIAGTHTAPLQPSCIGVNVGFVGSTDQSTLDVHIQTDVRASGTGLMEMRTAFTGDFQGNNSIPGPDFGKPIYANIEYTIEDVSYIVTEEPVFFGNKLSGAGYPDVRLDEWNHVLISWELISHTNTGGASKMWCAINDENKNGSDLPAMFDVPSKGPNDHWSNIPYYNTGEGKSVSVVFVSNNVPSDPIDIPGPLSVNRASDFIGGTTPVEPVVIVELAELQIFTGVTLDTSIETNRRAFIDYERDENGIQIKDKNGNFTLLPVSPVGKAATDVQPEEPAPAENLLNKKPEILLHGSSKWINGENTGTTGLDYGADPPAVKPDGQFKSTGKINPFTPDPSLSKSGSSTRRKAGPVRLTKAPPNARL